VNFPDPLCDSISMVKGIQTFGAKTKWDGNKT
jgi:hypothetical protein